MARRIAENARTPWDSLMNPWLRERAHGEDNADFVHLLIGITILNGRHQSTAVAVA